MIILALYLTLSPLRQAGCEGINASGERFEPIAPPAILDVRIASRLLMERWPSADLVELPRPRVFNMIRDSLGARAEPTLYWLMISDTTTELSDPMSSDSDDVAERAGYTYGNLGGSRAPVEVFLRSERAAEDWRAGRAAFVALAALDSFKTLSPVRRAFVCRVAAQLSSGSPTHPDEERLFVYLVRWLAREVPWNADAKVLLESPEIARARAAAAR